ncbi:lamin tail domain-containing protein [Saliphagus sp. GCM10025308]
MNRRELLALSFAGIAVGLTGCLNATERGNLSNPDENESEDTENGDATVGLRFVGIYADEADREFIDGEYILLQNESENSLDVAEYTIEYPSDHTYQIDELVVEPGAQLALLSRSGENATLQSSPPVYLRYAGFDEGVATSVLDENGTVRVRDTQESIVISADYENFGCDGGTVTTRSDDEVDCLH